MKPVLILSDNLVEISKLITADTILITTCDIHLDKTVETIYLTDRTNDLEIKSKSVILNTDNSHKLIHLISGTNLLQSIKENSELIILVNSAKSVVGTICVSDQFESNVTGLNLVDDILVSNKNIDKLVSHNPRVTGLSIDSNSVIKILSGSIEVLFGSCTIISKKTSNNKLIIVPGCQFKF